MTPEVQQAMLKEWYWGAIVLALIMVAFAPSFLKGKCIKCGKRNLRTVDISDPDLERLHQGNKETYTVFLRCDACQAKFKKVRSGPLEDASDPSYEAVFAAD
jgi:hypothetical protein